MAPAASSPSAPFSSASPLLAAPHRVGALEIGGALVRGRLDVAQDRQRDQLVAVAEIDAAHAHRGAALEHAHVVDGEADALAGGDW